MVPLVFFIDLILPAALWPWVDSEMNTKSILLGIKAAGASGWQPCHLQILIFRKFRRPQPSGALIACPGLCRGCTAQISGVKMSVMSINLFRFCLFV